MIVQQLKELEESLLQADLRKTPTVLDTLLADGFEEIGSSGYVASRNEVIHWLLHKEQDVRWSLENFQVRELAPGLMLATYRARKVGGSNATSSGSLRSSIWKRSGQDWQMIFHQGTKIVE